MEGKKESGQLTFDGQKEGESSESGKRSIVPREGDLTNDFESGEASSGRGERGAELFAEALSAFRGRGGKGEKKVRGPWEKRGEGRGRNAPSSQRKGGNAPMPNRGTRSYVFAFELFVCRGEKKKKSEWP